MDARLYQKWCYLDFIKLKDNEVDYFSKDMNPEKRVIIPKMMSNNVVYAPQVIILIDDKDVFLTMLRVDGKVFYRNIKGEIIQIRNEHRLEQGEQKSASLLVVNEPAPEINEDWFKIIFSDVEKKVKGAIKITTNQNITLLNINSKVLQAGEFVLESYDSLQKGIENKGEQNLRFKIIPDSVTDLIWKDTEKSVFQAASQFNCLEMAHPSATPENGITNYYTDKTQGPKCAIMCGAGTYYRNYLYNGGQTRIKQINTIEESLKSIGFLTKGNVISDGTNEFRYSNGYLLGDIKSHEAVGNILKNQQLLSQFRSNFNIGIHYDTQVWNTERTVHQVYASALPLSYSNIGKNDVIKGSGIEKFVQELNLVYETTILAAEKCRIRDKTDRKKVYLTLVGGGVFENPIANIVLAIRSVLEKYKHLPLDIILVDFNNDNKLTNNDFSFDKKIKYLKYKSKYLELKNLTNI